MRATPDMGTASAPRRRWTRRACVLAVALGASGCGFVSDKFGFDEVTRLTIEASVPVTIRLPPEDLPPANADFSQAVTLPVQVDVVEKLREMNRADDARTLEGNKGKIREVVLQAVEYEVREPNRLPASVDPVVFYIAPFDTETPDLTAKALGETVEVPEESAIASRELLYTSTGRADAAALLETLRFSVLLDTAFTVRQDRPIYAHALVLKLRLHLLITLDVAG